MKILYHHRTLSKDGQTVHIEGLIAAFRRLGHEVDLVGPPAAETSALGDSPGVVDRLKRLMPRAGYEVLELAYNAVAFLRLRREYRAYHPDALYERYNLGLFAGAWLRRRCGVPMVLEVNAPLVEERTAFGGLGLRRLSAAVEGLIWRSADVVVVVTDALAQKIRARGVPADRIAVIPNGVGPEFLSADLDGDAVRRRFGLEGRTILGFTGFVRDWHGLDSVMDVIAAADRSLGLHLLVAGDGPARVDLERRAQELGVDDRVTFAGIVPRAEIASFVAAFDIALQPRVVPYASPLKIFEYMAAARAIVAPNSANIREILVQERTALLIDPDRPAALSQAIERLAGDPSLRRRLGVAARAELRRRGLTWDDNARHVAGRIETLFARRDATAPSGHVATPSGFDQHRGAA